MVSDKNVQSGKLLSSKSKEAKLVKILTRISNRNHFGQRYKFYGDGKWKLLHYITESGTVLDVSAGRIANSSNVQPLWIK